MEATRSPGWVKGVAGLGGRVQEWGVACVEVEFEL